MYFFWIYQKILNIKSFKHLIELFWYQYKMKTNNFNHIKPLSLLSPSPAPPSLRVVFILTIVEPNLY